MKIKVNNCIGCPFCVTDIDTECVGNDTLLFCQPIRFLSKNISQDTHLNSYLYSYDSYLKEIKSNKKILKNLHPKWCPLLNDKLEIEYENSIKNYK